MSRSLSHIDSRPFKTNNLKIYHVWYPIDSMLVIKSQTLMSDRLLGIFNIFNTIILTIATKH
jgi:hypothetical protein